MNEKNYIMEVNVYRINLKYILGVKETNLGSIPTALFLFLIIFVFLYSNYIIFRYKHILSFESEI